LVDTFDFPLDPPHGEEASARFGFGNYSNRYEKYHAGEDWGFPNSPNLGKPVHSIGHGQVTYAAPNGWGLDGGAVVIRHVFPWGGYVLSFYGHLDPPSVTLRAGDCVRRGDQIGEIGDPTTSPHLHFEIRLHLPVSTGHGYWSTEPANAGWLPPSETIWETRLAASPGVLWAKSAEQGITQALGYYQDGLMFITGGEMRSLDPETGTLYWSQPISETIRTALLDTVTSQVYQLDLSGDLTAYALPNSRDVLWKSNINALSTAELIPLPDGGLMVADRRRVVAVSSFGETLWETETDAPVVSWVHVGDMVIFSTTNAEQPLWTADKRGIAAWDLALYGKLAVSNSGVFLYTEGALYRLNVFDQSASQLNQFPRTNLQSIDLVSRSDGGLLLIHQDHSDRRLLSIDPDGTLVWERSISAIPRGELRFVALGEAVFILNYRTASAGTRLDLYGLSQESVTLTHILEGGSHQSYRRSLWVTPINQNRLLINMGGETLAAFDPQSALSLISSP
jgi:outer membrane protein assembly factor BamB